MVWLAWAGGAFLVWLVLVFLFTPGIDYHLSFIDAMSERAQRRERHDRGRIADGRLAIWSGDWRIGWPLAHCRGDRQ